MSYIIEQKIKGKIYLYKVDSYWDSEKKQARQKRVYIGPKEGKKKSPLKVAISRLTTLNHGNIYFLNDQLNQTGLPELLQNIFPDSYKEMLALVLEEYIEFVSTELKKVYSSVEIKAPISLPKSAWIQSRARYRADSLIEFLSKQTIDGYLTIGLTTKDISTTKGEYPDWGLMGLGFCPGKSCIASSFRLKGQNKLEKLFKVAIHELGHTQGLQHCPVETCFMRDAEGKDNLNEEKEFCESCKKLLIKAGWGLK